MSVEKLHNRWILILSILIPVIVVALFGINLRELGFDIAPLTFLPPIYATINGLTAVLLILAFWAIKKQNIVLHENLMTTAVGCSAIFLLMYVAFHMTSESTPFGGSGAIKYVYYFILITHIILSIVVIPFVFAIAAAITVFWRRVIGSIKNFVNRLLGKNTSSLKE